MLQLFRTNQPTAAILLIFYAILIRLGGVLNPIAWQPEESGYFTDILYQWQDGNSWVGQSIALVLVLFQAYTLNALVNRYKLTKRPTYFTAVAYILVASFIPSYLFLTPILLANTFVALAITQLFAFYKNNNAGAAIFNAGFFIAIASLFYFGSGVFLLLGIYALIQLRSLNLRELFILITGFLVPFFLLGTALFWDDSLNEFWQTYIVNQLGTLVFEGNIDTRHYFMFGWYGFLVIWGILNSGLFFQKTGIQTRKNVSLIFTAIIVGGISVLYQDHISIEHLAIINIPAAILLAFNWTVIKNHAIAEFIHLIMVAVALFLQYQSLILN